jgi:hypothetical protein
MVYKYIMHYASCWWIEKNCICLKGVFQNNMEYHDIK